MEFEEFFSNLRHCFLFLNEIQMEAREIRNILRSHPLMLGSCRLKKPNTLRLALHAADKRMCEVIQENPQVLKTWVMGSKVERLQNLILKSRMQKTKFLLDLGIVDDSNEIGKALKVFRGSGAKIQERFDCIVEAGLSRKDVCEMIKASPQILNQTKDVLEMKIDFLVNNVGYPVSYLVTFPSYLNYTMERVELRLAMYNWLKDQGKSEPMLSLSTNYHVLCNYGIARSRIGKIYKEAAGVFGYDYGVLVLKLKAYEELGLGQSFMIKLVVCSPYLLIGEVNADFIKVLEILRKEGVDISRIEEHLSEKSSYDWSKLLALLNLFRHAGYNEKQLGGLISQHLAIFFEDSVDRIYLLIGFLLKFGSTMNQICSMFLQFPQVEFEEFFSNLRHCFLFLNEIQMEAHEIRNIFCSHPLMLGSCRLKKPNTLRLALHAAEKRMCEVVQESPQVLKKWVMGSKVERLPNLRLKSRKLKTKFLLDLGIVDNSNKIGKALKVFRGSGAKFQERFDCIVEAGLSRKDVCEMIKASPQILGQSKDVLEMKIDFLVNKVGYPVSYLVTFPSYLNFTTQRVELRLAMYNWLKDQGKPVPILSLRSLISLSDKKFINEYVNSHPRGPEIWQNLKKEIYAE
ncbi:hypothetical protein NC652_036219 [Populus alba x Populus x berolinensis]|nr:hypothetical protein NC652_036219 [Populus alba x Populus x berolinensis]